MASTVSIDRSLGDTPVSIYLGLEQGRTANLEAVAAASLAWVAALREMIAIVDPGVTVEVAIVDGDKSSLWLNTLLRLCEAKLEQIEKGGTKFPRLWALARGLAIIIVATPIAVTAEDVWRRLVGENPQVVELSEETTAELIEQFRMALKPDVAQEQKRQFFRALESDPSITSVGVSNQPSVTPPPDVTTRESFSQYVRAPSVDEGLEGSRTRIEILAVTLVSPVLENAERSWRFRLQGLPEFGAVMRDREFLTAIEHGGVHEELRQGIQMEIRIEFRERFEGGVWRTVERNVLEVIRPTYDRSRLL